MNYWNSEMEKPRAEGICAFGAATPSLKGTESKLRRGGVKVKLSEIPEQGLTLSERFRPEEMNLQTPELRFSAPLQITALFHREGSAVMVKVSATGDLEMICDRCGETYPQPYEGQFDLDYSVKNQFVLDITEDIRQEILLTYPIKFLCRETCQGLCPRCGKDLNEGPCSCSR